MERKVGNLRILCSGGSREKGFSGHPKGAAYPKMAISEANMGKIINPEVGYLYGISLKNLYRIRQRGYVSAPDRNGQIKQYDPDLVVARICEIERKKLNARRDRNN